MIDTDAGGGSTGKLWEKMKEKLTMMMEQDREDEAGMKEMGEGESVNQH